MELELVLILFFKMFPESDYKKDSNYFFKLSITEKIALYFKIVSRLSSGFLKSIYEHLKSLIIFPLFYNFLSLKNKKNLFFFSSDQKKFLNDGIIIKKLDKNDLYSILEQIKEAQIYLDEIDTKNDPRFKIKINNNSHQDLFRSIKHALIKHGYDKFAKRLLKRDKVRLEEMYLFIQDTSKGWRDEVPELTNGKRVNTRYFHIDSSPKNKIVKFILYLNEVNENNGPFEYVLGSHKMDKFPFTFIRRVIHHSRIQDLSLESRKLFSLLPRFLQYKAEIGNDINNENWNLHSEVFYGKKGTIVIFNNSGLHRGGLIKNGRRITIHGGFR